LPDIIIQGSLKAAFLGRLVDEWMGDSGGLKRLAVKYRGMDIPGQPLIAAGTVTNISIEEGSGVAECEIWLESSDGSRGTIGEATVILPTRSTAG
jgi:hypothetical protein